MLPLVYPACIAARSDAASAHARICKCAEKEGTHCLVCPSEGKMASSLVDVEFSLDGLLPKKETGPGPSSASIRTATDAELRSPSSTPASILSQPDSRFTIATFM